MSTIVTRAGKGSALTHTEVDANFTNLNTDKLQSGNTAASLAITSATINGGSINGTTVGATTPAAGTFTSLSDSGNLAFTGTGNRITGDFSNATIANRVLFQTSTVNGNTVVQALPNGSGPGSYFGTLNNSDTNNFSRLLIGVSQTLASIESQAQGTGGFLPLTFYTGGSERMRVDTSGNLGIGTSSPANLLNIQTAATGTTVASNIIAKFQSNGTGRDATIQLSDNVTNSATISMLSGATVFSCNGVESARIDSSGNLKFNSGYGSVATAYGCRAWVNFNGTGTVAIRASGNVSSITDNGTGAYTVNFTTAMSDANYAFNISRGVNPGMGFSAQQDDVSAPTTTGIRFVCVNAANTSLQDVERINVAIFR